MLFCCLHQQQQRAAGLMSGSKMAYKITLECGDVSCLRTKKTPEGYTHDWEVFVRGADNAPIHQYIEKGITKFFSCVLAVPAYPLSLCCFLESVFFFFCFISLLFSYVSSRGPFFFQYTPFSTIFGGYKERTYLACLFVELIRVGNFFIHS